MSCPNCAKAMSELEAADKRAKSAGPIYYEKPTFRNSWFEAGILALMGLLLVLAFWHLSGKADSQYLDNLDDRLRTIERKLQ